MKALVAGCFSFPNGHGTAGDVLACDVVCGWLEQAGCAYDVAMVQPVGEGLDWRCADPQQYSHLVYVCGPFLRGDLETGLLVRFGKCRLIGVDLSMLAPLEQWNPFDLLLERDSSQRVHPDIAFASLEPTVPVVGVCLVEEYEGGRVAEANAAIARLMAGSKAAIVNIDTRLDENSTGLRSPAEVESLLARMDAVVTTRLHGMVLSLKNGVPVVAIDVETGGAKVRRQAECLGWPAVFTIDQLNDEVLREALAYSLTAAAQAKAEECRQRALALIDGLRQTFLAGFEDGATLDAAQRERDARLVSVVIPCYNQAAFLAEAIESVLAQTHRNHEIIVVDDGSQDATGEVAARYPQVRYIRQRNGGLSDARNAGLKASRGQYLVFLDADDRLLPDTLQSGLNCLHLYPEAAFVSGHYRYIRTDGSLLLEYAQQPLEGDPYQAMLRRNYVGMHAAVMYQRRVFDDVGGFDTTLKSCEDYDLYLRITRRYPVASYNHIVAEYRTHEESMSVNAARMLSTATKVLGAQWPYINENRAQIRAYRSGIRYLRLNALQPLLSGLRSNVKARRWLRATRLLLKLPAYLPPLLRTVWLDMRLSARLAFGSQKVR